MPRKSADPKTRHLLVRLTPGQLEFLHEAAAERHLSMASWARQTLLDEATRLLPGRQPEAEGE